ncbi:MAG: hypothetical protein ACTSVV_16215 [Promethearchaeota archaeon]
MIEIDISFELKESLKKNVILYGISVFILFFLFFYISLFVILSNIGIFSIIWLLLVFGISIMLILSFYNEFLKIKELRQIRVINNFLEIYAPKKPFFVVDLSDLLKIRIKLKKNEGVGKQPEIIEIQFIDNQNNIHTIELIEDKHFSKENLAKLLKFLMNYAKENEIEYKLIYKK